MTLQIETVVVPTTGFLRIDQILKIIPISKASWYRGVKSGEFPPKIHLGARTVVWRAKDILDFIDKQGSQQDD